MGDDLLITNKYISENVTLDSDKEIYEKLDRSKKTAKNRKKNLSPDSGCSTGTRFPIPKWCELTGWV